MENFTKQQPNSAGSILIIASLAESLRNFRGPLIDSLLSAGMTVHVAAPDISNELKKYFEDKNIIAHEIPMQRTGMNPIKDYQTFNTLRKLIKTVAPDRVLAYTIKPVIYGLLAAGAGSPPRKIALITGLGYAFTENKQGIVPKIAASLYRTALKRANVIFFQNPDDKQLFEERKLTSSKSKIVVVNGSGIDTVQFSAHPLPENKIIFLMIARLLGNKGTREYAAAAKILKEKHPDTEFQLVGWIDDNPDSIHQHELDTWINEGSINYLGKMKDVRPALQAASVYVLPSYREGTPRTVLEAMATGRAIITTDAPGCKETVISGVNGFLVPIKSREALAKAMEELILYPEKIRTMGEASRKMAEEKYDVAKVNRAMTELF